MAEHVKTRRYHSEVRAQRAAATRRAVLGAARRLFTEKGYAATGVTEIAALAEVSVDTVYASVGRKPELLVAVLDMTLGASDDTVEAEDRAYVRAIRAAPTAEQKIAVYARALGKLLPHTTPLMLALEQAARTDDACAVAWRALGERRAANMRLFAADLRGTGRLRSDLTDDEVADIVWSTNAPQYFALLTERGWSSERIARLLQEMWSRLLLS